MITKTITINSMDKIKTFVDIINKFNGRFDLVSGCSIVNAKSIMPFSVLIFPARFISTSITKIPLIMLQKH